MIEEHPQTPETTAPDPTAPDVAGLFKKVGIPAERAKDLLERYADNLDVIAKHAAKIV